jgi:hypothetical protein
MYLVSSPDDILVSYCLKDECGERRPYACVMCIAIIYVHSAAEFSGLCDFDPERQ